MPIGRIKTGAMSRVPEDLFRRRSAARLREEAIQKQTTGSATSLLVVLNSAGRDRD